MDTGFHLLTLVAEDHLTGLYLFGKITLIISTTITFSLLAFALLLALSNGLTQKSGLVVAPSIQAFTAGLSRRGLMRREAPPPPLTLSDLIAGESDADQMYYINDSGEISTYSRR